MHRILTMRLLAFATCICFGSISLAQVAPKVVETNNPDLKDSKSYALGWQMGDRLSKVGCNGEDFDTKELLAGFIDGLSKKGKLSPKQVEAAFQALDLTVQKRMAELTKKNLETANQFLKTNKEKDGIQTTKTGLQYLVLSSGKGKQPGMASTVTVNYEGKLLNGTVFDSSIASGQPITMRVDRFVEGWQEALQRMKVGDKWKLFVPPGLGYKEEGFPPDIGPNELLVFELELLDVK